MAFVGRSRQRAERRRRVMFETIAIAIGGVVGAAAMYFADPDRGRRRRALARDRFVGWSHQGSRRTARLARRPRAEGYGLVKKARYLPHAPAVVANDQMLTDRILSRAFRGFEIAPGRVTVSVEHGVAVLLGALDRPEQIRALNDRVAGVSGVVEAASYLHLVGTPAIREGVRHDPERHDQPRRDPSRPARIVTIATGWRASACPDRIANP